MELERLSFKGTDYLNITKNKEFQHFLYKGFKKYGSSFGGSRLSGNFSNIHEEAENRLAEISGAQASVSFSSGTLAGLILINQLKEHELIYSPDAHPAIKPNTKQKTDKSYDEWVEFLLNTYHKPGKGLVILSNSLNALKCEKYHFAWIDELAKNRKITTVLDDSHGFGILGKNGAGIYNTLTDYDHIEKIVISSLGKAWGIPGGVILGSSTLIEKLKKSALFGGGSPIIPAYFNAFLKAENIYVQNRKKLKDNIKYFKTKLDKPEMFHSFEGFPAFHTKNHEIYDLLNKEDIEISSFNYPSPEDEKYTRIVLNSGHSHKEIDRLCNLLNK